jgi:ribosome maturation factor RimP
VTWKLGHPVAFFAAMYTDLLQLEEELDQFLYDFGYQAVHLQIATHGRDRRFRLFIDRVDGQPVTISDCSAMAHQVQLFLEAKAIYNENSSLELSSAGVDRLLKRDRDFERFLGSEVKVVFRKEGHKETVQGELSSFTDDLLLISQGVAEGAELSVSVPRGDVVQVNLVPKLDFRRS